MAHNEEFSTGIKTGNCPSYSCVICSAHLSSPSYKHNLIGQFTGSEGNECSTEGNTDLINEQLLLYFIVKKLLKFEDEQFLELLLCFDSEKRVDSLGFDDDIYFSKFCVNCEKIISNAIEVHKNLIKLQRNISELGERLRNSVKCSVKTSNRRRAARENKMANKIRSFIIHDECDSTTDWNENEAGELVSSPNFQQGLKVEAECAIDGYDDFESYNDLCDEMVNWDNNSLDSKENTAGAWTRKVKDEGTGNESDSDYKPEDKFLTPKSIKKRCQIKQKVSSATREITHTSITGQSSFTCHICNMVHNTAHGFRNHLKAHKESANVHGNKYDCPKCKFPALSERKLRYHLTKAHDETNKNTCSICGYVGSRRWLYDKHMLEKHDIQVWTPIDKETNETVNANNTSTTYDVEADIPDDNTAKETESENARFCCEKCKSVYKTRLHFVRHQEAHELSEDLNHKFDCEKCGFPANSEKFLRYHMIKEHKQYLMRTCTLCGHQVKRLDQMKLHMKNKHSQSGSTMRRKSKLGGSKTIDRLKCKLCAYNCASSGLLRKHMLEKHDDQVDKGTNKKTENEATNTTPNYDEPEIPHDADSTGNFQCETCKTVYKTRAYFHRHQEAHKLSQNLNHKFDCDECGFPANSEKFLRYHKIKEHKQYLMRTCTLCGHQVKRLGQMKLHMKNKHSQSGSTMRGKSKLGESTKSNGRLHCNLCGYNYANSRSLRMHMENHEKSIQIDKKWDCSRCGFPCLNEKQLCRHVQIKHEKDPLTCSICQRSFGRRNLLKAHLLKHKQFDKTLDPTTGLFCCDLCPNKYSSLEGVILHKALGHPDANNCLSTGGVGEDSHLCQQCGRCYTTSLQLRRHIKIKHEGYITHTCEVCGKGINGSKVKLLEHMKIHEENRVKEFVCEICGSAYSAKDTLTKHVKKYHPNGDGFSVDKVSTSKRNYKCKFCVEVFPLKLLFEKHLESVHSDMYSFQCNLCDKSYISSSSLRLHKEINHGEGGGGAHSCQYCKKQFTHKHYVVCHYRWCSVKRKQALKQETT